MPTTKTAVDPNISDLFFNTEHRADEDDSIPAQNTLTEEAREFLDCLEQLGVSVPTVEELIADFYGRL